MKLAVLIAVLCASCTAITLVPERPKPQLQRANKLLALRGGGAGSVPAPAVGANPIVQFFVQLVSVALKNNQPGLIAIFVWSLPYVIGAIPGAIGKFAQQFFFAAYYVSEDKMDIKHGKTAYIRWEILFILGSLANTAVFMLTLDQSAHLRLRLCSAVWALTFTFAIIKFYEENQRGWIVPQKYKSGQLVHVLVAFFLWYGVLQSQ
eukprot:scaffold67300_cov67-Phaeocystis_antarctica.AAC.2